MRWNEVAHSESFSDEFAGICLVFMLYSISVLFEAWDILNQGWAN